MANWSGPVEDSNEFGMRHERRTDDGRIAHVAPQLFNALLGISRQGASTYLDVWEYPTAYEAYQALVSWDIAQFDEPPMWTRHPATGRRRPGGDPSRQFVRL